MPLGVIKHDKCSQFMNRARFCCMYRSATQISHPALLRNASEFVARGADHYLGEPYDEDLRDLIDQEKAL